MQCKQGAECAHLVGVFIARNVAPTNAQLKQVTIYGIDKRLDTCTCSYFSSSADSVTAMNGQHRH